MLFMRARLERAQEGNNSMKAVINQLRTELAVSARTIGDLVEELEGT